MSGDRDLFAGFWIAPLASSPRSNDETPERVERNAIALAQRCLDLIQNEIDDLARLTPRKLRFDGYSVNHIRLRQRRISLSAARRRNRSTGAAWLEYTQAGWALLPPAVSLPRKDFAERAQCEDVARGAETAHDASASGCRHAGTAKSFARGDVRDVDLDDGNSDRGDRVRNCIRVVRVCAGVDHNAVAARPGRVKRIDDFPLTAVLLAANVDAKILRRRGDRVVQLAERLGSVKFGLAFTEQVEIRSMYNQNAHRFRFFEGKARAFEPEALMPDSLVAATNLDAGVALVAAITTELVAEIRDRHDLWPTAAAAVGRLTTGAALFSASLKGNERISLQIAGNGPLQAIAAEAWLLDGHTAGARGFARNGRVELPVDHRGKFDVAGAVGTGSLQVTRSSDVGQPYVGVVPLRSGEIGEDLAAYLAQSEQIPSIVALGVLANPNGVVAAGGILARALPGAEERVLVALEERAANMPPVTQLITQGADAPALLAALAGDVELRSHHTIDVRFACRCNRSKVEAVLLGLGADELLELTRERDRTEATCEYCKTHYVFSAQEIRELAERL